jgi:WD40 repeat protein
VLHARILLGGYQFVRGVAFSPNGRTLVSVGYDESVRIWNRREGREVGNPLTLDTAPVQAVAFAPDGSFFVTASDDGAVRLWPVSSSSAAGATAAAVCRFVGAGLSRAESAQYAPGLPVEQGLCSRTTPEPPQR